MLSDEQIKKLSLEEIESIKDYSDRGSLTYMKVYLRFLKLKKETQ